MNKLNILVSLITDANDYQLEQAASAQSAAIQLGASVQIIYSGNDAVQQTQEILGFIQNPAKRPDAILAEPVGTGMAQIARAAVTAGIAWAIVNAEVDYISPLRQLQQHSLVPVFSILSDHDAIGKIQGQQIAAILGDTGRILYIEGPSGNVAKLRTKGMLSTKPGSVDVKTVKGDWTQKSGHHAVAAVRLGVSPDYLYRNHRRLPFTRRMGRSLRFSSAGIEQYIRRVSALTPRR
jgi:hypothetical protein